MTVHVHRSQRTDTLLAGLAALLRDAPADPFTPEVVAVPTPGIERFITQGLGLVLGTSGGHDGVCANVRFPSPSEVVHDVISETSGVTSTSDPWLPRRCVWPLLRVIDESLDESWCTPLRVYLEGPGTDRRFALASKLARLFASYASQRPSLLLQWARGAEEVGPGLHWQPLLWRRLRDEIGSASPAERLEGACLATAEDPDVVNLPERLSVFGPNRLPADHLLVLQSLGVHRAVHLWIPDPSPALWTRLHPTGVIARKDDTSASHVAHPLLRSLGRDTRELRQRLGGDFEDDFLPADVPGDTVLAELQRQISSNTDPAGLTKVTVQADDDSICVHACHGQARQAEVVREVIQSLLQADPTLQPRDILIMCPDLDAFAPLLSAAFSTPDPTGNLRLRIADRTPQQGNEVLTTLAALLELATSRAPRSAVMDFAAKDPVRTRFGFDDDDLERLEFLTEQAGIRWGLDGAHRGEYALPTSVGTWLWGMDRLLLGVTMSEDGLALLDAVLPVDDVQSSDVHRVGHLAELVSRLIEIRARLRGRHSVSAWATILTSAVDLLMDVRPGDAWQIPNALGSILSLMDSSGDYGPTVEMSLADVSWLLSSLLEGRPTRSNFRSGDLTVCGLAPMRSVPHRVVCLVGMDDAAFPRSASVDGDDVLALNPLIGERDVRSEDRHVLLDAIMAATDHLVITYTGADERTNQPRPPCVPLGDLLDAVDAMATTPSGGPARTQIVTHHPLQPFDVRNFTGSPFSHDEHALSAAVSASHDRIAKPTLLLEDLPPVSETDISLADLVAFLVSPSSSFLKKRLGLSFFSDSDPAPEEIPVEAVGLQKWSIGARAMSLLSAGESVQQVASAEWARGQLPPGALGEEVMRPVGSQALDIVNRCAQLRKGEPSQVDIALPLPDNRRLVGTVSDVFDDRIVRSSFSGLKPRDDLRLWPALLAVAATSPGHEWSGFFVGRNNGIVLRAPANPAAILADLVELYLAGLQAPLPVTADCGYWYAKTRSAGAKERPALWEAQRRGWNGDYGDGTKPEVTRIWGTTFDALITAKPNSHENWFAESTRFGMLARRVWDPILQAKERL